MSELALKLIAEAKRTKAKKLDLGMCGLKKCPDELFELIDLEEFYLCNFYWGFKERKWIKSENTGRPNHFYSIPDEINKLKSLRIFHCNGDFDYGNWSISDISFLKELKQLQSLYLSHNNLSDISSLKGLNQLQSLDLRDNEDIKDFSSLKELKQIQSFFIRGNKNVKDFSFLKEPNQLKSLDLSYNYSYSYNTSSLKEFKQLESLYLRYNHISDISFLEELKQLESLDLSDNQDIKDFSFLEKLKQLKSLDLSNNKKGISDISFLEELIQLKFLNLSDNKGISVFSSLKELKQLESLDLSDNQDIKDFSFLEELKQLKSLDLSDNNISNISFLKEYKQLESLDLSNNNISDISFLKEHKQLQSLDLRNNNISNISFLKELKQLKSLDLSNDNISDISFLKELKQLQSLDLRNNNISDISFLEELKQLESLDLSNNNISDISFLKELKQLQSLDLRDNIISDILPILNLIEKGIPLTLDERFRWKTINLSNNPLNSPSIEIVKLGNYAVLNYFEEIEKQGTDFIYEAKLLIVGEGGAGKTTLARKLIDPLALMPKEEETTKGIDIYKMIFTSKDKNNYTVNIWDFGGQEIYHATHQFFLTKRSLYLLVDDTRKDDKNLNNEVFNYWFQTVELFGGDSPLLILQNEKGDRSKDIDFLGMKAKFSFLQKKIPCNLLDNRGLAEVIKSIQEQIQQLPHMGDPIPKQWLKIRNELSTLQQENSFIQVSSFFEICKKHEIPEKDRALALSDYLHHLGFFLHFQDDPLLKQIVILQNGWATEAVYKIIDSELIKSKKGLFTKADAAIVWSEEQYCRKNDELLVLMIKFELCYEIKDVKEKSYLIPQLLSVSRPKDYRWEPASDLQLRYKYEFMPKGLFSRFIVRMHHHLTDRTKAWRSGVVLERNGATAEVTELFGKSEIDIRVKGMDRKELLTIIDEAFNSIHRPLENLVLTKLIPCNCTNCLVLQEPHFYKYDKLKERLGKGKMTIECDTPDYLEVNISDLLYEVFDRKRSNAEEILDRMQYDIAEVKAITRRTEIVVKETNKLLSFYLTDMDKVKYPYLFTLAPPSYELQNSHNLVTTKYKLQFFCMDENAIHPTGKAYDIEVPKEWVIKMAPYYNPILKVIKSITHLILPGFGNAFGQDTYKTNKHNLEGFRDSIRALEPIDTGTTLRKYQPEEASEACMELLKEVLQKCDPKNTWKQHLHKKIDNGKVIWVCSEH